MPLAYRIRNWDEHFETSESRKRKGLSWVAIPTKHDGKTFRRLMRKQNAAAIYGAWILIVAVGAKCPSRGLLVDDDGPLTADDLETKTGLDSSIFALALQTLTGTDIRWIETLEYGEHTPKSADAPAECADTPCLPDRTGPDRTGHYKTGPANPVFKNDWKAPETATLRDTQQLLTWLNSEGRKAGLQDLPEVQTRVIAAAERALDHGTNKPRFFGSLIRDLARGDHEKLTGEYLDRAKVRLRGITETNGVAAALADSLKVSHADED